MPDYLIVTSTSRAVSALPVEARWRATGDAADLSFRTEHLDESEEFHLANDPGVLSFAQSAPTALIRPTAMGASIRSEDAWGIHTVGADESPYSGRGVHVAVLDTGIDPDHAAFRGVKLNVRSFVGGSILDANGHGTHCAGTIFGRDVDGLRIGVSPNVPIASIAKVLDDQGAGSTASLLNGLNWATSVGAQVVSMSLSIDFARLVSDFVDAGWPVLMATSRALGVYRDNLRIFDALVASVHRTTRGGSLILAAVGNDSVRDKGYIIDKGLPAAAEGVLAVGAIDQAASRGSYVVADFSNAHPHLVAPGCGVLSARSGGGLIEMSGTSMACPHVAGVVCQYLERNIRAGIGQVTELSKAQLLASAIRPRGSTSEAIGMGLVQAPT